MDKRKSMETKVRTRKTTMDDFEIGNFLGSGSYGSVFMVREKLTNREYAIKAIKKAVIRRFNVQPQFDREVVIQMQLRHPHILRVFNVFEDKRQKYLVLEYAPGGDLEEFMLSQPQKRFEDKRAALYVSQIAKALHYCHLLYVIHRDIKPQNLLLTRNKDIKIGDFGCCIGTDSKRQTAIGTVDYTAPEMVHNLKYDRYVDHWALGILCYEMLVGKTPFQSPSMEETNHKIATLNYTFPPHVQESARHLITGLLQLKPSDRMSLPDIRIHPWICTYKSKLSVI